MSALVSLGVCCALLWWVVRAKRARERAPAPQERPNLSTAAPSDVEPQLPVVPVPAPPPQFHFKRSSPQSSHPQGAF